MPEAERKGDPNTGGGVIIAGARDVFVNNLETGLLGSPVSGHLSHRPTSVAVASPVVFADNIKVTYKGAADACGHARAGGSLNVFVGLTATGTAVSVSPPPSPPPVGVPGPEPDTTIVTVTIAGETRTVTIYANTPAGIASLIASESGVSPNLPTYHEESPGDAPPDEKDPTPKPVEGCIQSKYFVLVDSKMTIIAQNGFTQGQLECNWIALCTNILDRVIDAGFKFKINSGFRTLAYNASIGSSNASDHTIACAADISMGTQAANKTLFKLMLNKYPYSQLIFEGNWVHVAYGGRAPKGNAKVMYTYTGRSPVSAGANGENLPADLKP